MDCGDGACYLIISVSFKGVRELFWRYLSLPFSLGVGRILFPGGVNRAQIGDVIASSQASVTETVQPPVTAE